MRVSRAQVSPPLMSSRHSISEPYGRWHATIYSYLTPMTHTLYLYAIWLAKLHCDFFSAEPDYFIVDHWFNHLQFQTLLHIVSQLVQEFLTTQCASTTFYSYFYQLKSRKLGWTMLIRVTFPGKSNYRIKFYAYFYRWSNKLNPKVHQKLHRILLLGILRGTTKPPFILLVFTLPCRRR